MNREEFSEFIRSIAEVIAADLDVPVNDMKAIEISAPDRAPNQVLVTFTSTSARQPQIRPWAW